MDTPSPIDLHVPSAGAIQDHRWVRFGSFELHWIETGDIWLDGGAMFGVVPKALWSDSYLPTTKPHSNDYAVSVIRSLTTGRLYLIDNGAGNKFNKKCQHLWSFLW